MIARGHCGSSGGIASVAVDVGWVPPSTNLRAASARLRCYNIVATLAASRGDVRVAHVDDPGARRVVVLSKRYDQPALQLACRTKRAGGAVILDLCDNHFYASGRSAGGDKRRDQLIATIGAVDHLVVSTVALREVVMAESGYSGSITVIGDPVEDILLAQVPVSARDLFGVARFEPLRRRRVMRTKGRTRGRLVWFGAHGVPYADGGMLDLLDIRPVLVRLGRQYDLSLTVVSNRWSKYVRHIRGFGVPTRYFDWNPRGFPELLAAHDVCVVPIRANPFTVCKTNNRVATALWYGLPVVASSIPSYEELRPFVVLDDWERGLTRYLEQPELAAAQVSAARAHLRAHYSLEAIARQWASVLNQVAEQKDLHAQCN